MTWLSALLRPVRRPDPVAEAELRWRERNAEVRASGCRCGRPATEVRYDNRNVGNVSVEFWTCTDHVDVNSWSSNDGGETWTPQPNGAPR